MVHGEWTSSAVAEEVKNGINITRSRSDSHANFHSTNGYGDRDFLPDSMDIRPTIYIDTKAYESDDSFDSDISDDNAEPEVEPSPPVKRPTSFGKTAFHSLKRNFITKGKVKQDASSLHAPLIDSHRTKSLGSIQQTRISKADHLRAQVAVTKSTKLKSRSNPSFE